MKRLLIPGAVVVLAAVAAVVLAVALVGGGEGGSGTTSTAAAPQPGDVVSVREIDGVGDVLVDASGQALYAADEEASGMVLCTDECLSFWTPLTVTGDAPAGSELNGELAVVERPDGANQVTYEGKLLYSFSLDSAGEVTGDGFADAFGGQQFTWHVVHGDGTTGSAADSPSDVSGLPGY
jgi:predicted lipoprotein with Yx(FWY)xxD motif